MENEPKPNDLILGGTLPPPTAGVVLGGIQGLRQRLKEASPEQKVALLPQSLNYGDAGLDLLVEAVEDASLIVRATACQLLQPIDSPKAQHAIANGLRLNPGDRIFSVYESVIGYNDWCYDLLQTYEDAEDFAPVSLVSQHIHRSSAKKAAQLHHQWRSFQDSECFYLPHIGWDITGGIRETFDVVHWCRTHQVLIRLPGESQTDFEHRLNASGYSLDQTDRLVEEHEFILQELSRDFFEEGETTAPSLGIQKKWNLGLRRILEERAIEFLQASQQYELLAQLWLEAAGTLAFVREEWVNEPIYITILENL